MSTISHPPISVLDAGLGYARGGWPVFPLFGAQRVGFGCDTLICTCSRGATCEHPAKHPAVSGGFHAATTDERAIRSWFTNRSDFNLAIATGNGLAVLDCDRRHDGHRTLAALERRHGKIPRDPEVITGNGGHIYLRYDRRLVLPSGSGLLGPGLDLKADNGYVVAPPSLHFSGHRYHWHDGSSPPRAARMPRWLLDLARSGALRVGGAPTNGNRDRLPTEGHKLGNAIAKLLGGVDRGTWWKIDYPSGSHASPDAALYPLPDNAVYFRCFSANACSHRDMMMAVREMLRDGAR